MESHVGFICKSSKRVKNDANKDHFALRERLSQKSRWCSTVFQFLDSFAYESATLPVLRGFMTPSSLRNISPFFLNYLE